MKVIDRKDVTEYHIHGLVWDHKTKTLSYDPGSKDVINNPKDFYGLDKRLMACYDYCPVYGNLRGDYIPRHCFPCGSVDWQFKSEDDMDAIWNQINKVFSVFQNKFQSEPIMITHRCESFLAFEIGYEYMERLDRAGLFPGTVRQLTTEEVYGIVSDFGTVFRDKFNTKEKFDRALDKLCKYLDVMDKDRRGRYTRSIITDEEFRDVVDQTLQKKHDHYSRQTDIFDDEHVLVIIDTISNFYTIDDIYEMLAETYTINSLSVLICHVKLT